MDAVLNWLWQGGIVAVASVLMLAALKRTVANVRYAVCWAALLLIVALPALPTVAWTSPASDAFFSTEADPLVSLPDRWWTSTFLVLAAWMAWASIQLVRFMSAIVAIRRARARSRAFPSNLESVLPHWRRVRSEGRRARLVLSDSVASAAVFGWGRPMIAVAPSVVRTLAPDDLDRVLIHEWAHVQRHDDVVNMLQIVVRMGAGWHPALWWIDRRLHVEREIACDEMTVAITGSPKSYAECLLKLSTLGVPRAAIEIAPAVFTPSGLRRRVVRIVSPPRAIAAMWSRVLAAATVLGLCLVTVAAGGVTVVEATVFARPLTPARMLTLSTPLDRPVSTAPVVSSDPAPERLADRLRRRPPVPHRAEKEPPVPPPTQSRVEPPPPATPPDAPELEATRTAEGEPGPAPTAAPEVTDAPPGQPASVATAEMARSPWSTAADGGVAIGRKAKDAGVATAGFFTRFARRVGGSF